MSASSRNPPAPASERLPLARRRGIRTVAGSLNECSCQYLASFLAREGDMHDGVTTDLIHRVHDGRRRSHRRFCTAQLEQTCGAVGAPASWAAPFCALNESCDMLVCLGLDIHRRLYWFTRVSRFQVREDRPVWNAGHLPMGQFGSHYTVHTPPLVCAHHVTLFCAHLSAE